MSRLSVLIAIDHDDPGIDHVMSGLRRGCGRHRDVELVELSQVPRSLDNIEAAVRDADLVVADFTPHPPISGRSPLPGPVAAATLAHYCVCRPLMVIKPDHWTLPFDWAHVPELKASRTDFESLVAIGERIPLRHNWVAPDPMTGSRAHPPELFLAMPFQGYISDPLRPEPLPEGAFNFSRVRTAIADATRILKENAGITLCDCLVAETVGGSNLWRTVRDMIARATFVVADLSPDRASGAGPNPNVLTEAVMAWYRLRATNGLLLTAAQGSRVPFRQHFRLSYEPSSNDLTALGRRLAEQLEPLAKELPSHPGAETAVASLPPEEFSTHSAPGRLERVVNRLRAMVVDRRRIRLHASSLPEELTADLRTAGYRPGQLLGVGANGNVFAGVREHDGLVCAIKVGPRHAMRPAELDVLRDVHHDNLVDLLDNGESGEFFWIAMTYAGSTLESLLAGFGGEASERLPVETAIYITRSVLAGLDVLHRVHGLVHRDLKTSNILVDADLHVRLADFGLVRTMGGLAGTMTVAGGLLGSPRYMSPEHIDGNPGPDSDVFAVGTILWEMLAGRPLFDQADRWELWKAIKGEGGAELPETDDTVPPELLGFVRQCLARSRSERLADATVALAAFEEATRPILDRLAWLRIRDDDLLARYLETAGGTAEAVARGFVEFARLDRTGITAADLVPVVERVIWLRSEGERASRAGEDVRERLAFGALSLSVAELRDLVDAISASERDRERCVANVRDYVASEVARRCAPGAGAATRVVRVATTPPDPARRASARVRTHEDVVKSRDDVLAVTVTPGRTVQIVRQPRIARPAIWPRGYPFPRGKNTAGATLGEWVDKHGLPADRGELCRLLGFFSRRLCTVTELVQAREQGLELPDQPMLVRDDPHRLWHAGRAGAGELVWAGSGLPVAMVTALVNPVAEPRRRGSRK